MKMESEKENANGKSERKTKIEDEMPLLFER